MASGKHLILLGNIPRSRERVLTLKLRMLALRFRAAPRRCSDTSRACVENPIGRGSIMPAVTASSGLCCQCQVRAPGRCEAEQRPAKEWGREVL